MYHKKRFLLLCMSALTAAVSYADFHGTIIDAEGEPMIGVNVIIKDNGTGTITDMDGNFKIESKLSKATIQATYLGYKPIEITAQQDKPLSITMEEDSEQLEEVVAIGYGVQKKSDLTGAIAQVSSDELSKHQAVNVGEALSGLAPGLQVTSSGAPGSNVSMQIRGVGSINGSNPLLVIDGVPTDAPLNMLNMDDVETVDVLKDASATAIYGSRGAYGVVIITTKKGNKDNNNHLGIKASYGVDKIANTIPLLNSSQFASMHNEMMKASGQRQNPAFEDPTLLTQSTDWVNNMIQLGQVQNYSINFSGGTDKVTYYLSGSYLNQKGVVRTTSYDRLTFQANVDAKMYKWLKIGTNLSFNHDVKQNGEWNLQNAMLSLPTQRMKYDDGSWAGPNGLAMYVGDIANPVGKMYENHKTTKGYNFLGNAYVEIIPWEPLSFKSTIGVQAMFWDEDNWTPAYNWEPIPQYESYRFNKFNKSLTWTWDNTLTFNKTFNKKHVVSAMIGTSMSANHYKFMDGSIQGFLTETASQLSNGTDVETMTLSGNVSEWALLSFMARANYVYDNRYYITATVREDGSSRFAKGHRWGTFPSVSLAWRPSGEAFFPKNKVVSDMKVRFGFGMAGNQSNVSNYEGTTKLRIGQYVFNGSQVPILYSHVMPNPNVTWETVVSYNVGLDMKMADDHLMFSVDGYVKDTKNMLTNANVQISSGYSDIDVPRINAGTVRNAGVEVGITSFNFKDNGDGFNWTTTLNFSYNHNQIISLPDGKDIYSQTGNVIYNVNSVGHPINAFYGYVCDGIFQTQEEIDNHAIQTIGSSKYNSTQPGDIKFKDLNSDGVIDENDRTFLGSPTPSWTFSLNNTFKIKGFDIEIYFYGVAGNKIYNATRASLEAMSVAQNQAVSVLDRWNDENHSTTMPRAVANDPNNNNRVSDRFIEDGSYLRLKNLSFGYTIPQRLTKKAAMSNVRVYISGSNLFTITKYKGLDPEVGGTGVDFNVYPISLNITAGASITF